MVNAVKSPLLKNNGLNMLAVFNLESLPETIQANLQQQISNYSNYNQLFLFAHAGPDMWRALQQSAFIHRKHPVDEFSQHTVQTFFNQALPEIHYRLLYPDQELLLPLQQLGELAGWAYNSPFRIGIHQKYGSWFAYRVVALTDSTLPETGVSDSGHPCESCETKPCLQACPADALAQGQLSLDNCLHYRQTEDSRCTNQCLSRLACPVGKKFCYSKEQLTYHYDISLKTIKEIRSSAESD